MPKIAQDLNSQLPKYTRKKMRGKLYLNGNKITQLVILRSIEILAVVGTVKGKNALEICHTTSFAMLSLSEYFSKSTEVSNIKSC